MSVYFLFGANYIYFVVGFVASLAISLACFNVKIIDKKSELLYLSLGFYKYFIKLYLSNILKQIIVQIKTLLIPSFIDPQTIKVDLSAIDDQENMALFEASLNLMVGYSILKVESDHILVGAINENYKKNFRPKKIFKDIKNINDDSLV
ncbi:MAG: hypothetical protein ISQ34_03825 [Rickettsiales bacterium]|nr:hypothetical protein [Rickettsiales bacterium]